jgi:adenine-specific DNA-methyltransferase
LSALATIFSRLLYKGGEAGDAGFDALIACASARMSRVPSSPDWVAFLKAQMNADLHMADTLKNTGARNLFVIFGGPDIDITEVDDGLTRVKIYGIDVFHSQTSEVKSSDADEIAC